eukprot:scaffold1159_cov160-Ochromonas_danica.AAC.21
MDAFFGSSQSSDNKNNSGSSQYGSGGSASSFQNVRAIDLNKLAPLYGVPAKQSSGPEFIPFNPRGRDFYGRLSFLTGMGWLGGFFAGGAWGVYHGWTDSVSPNYRIRINNILNKVASGGSSGGSLCGVIGTRSSLSSHNLSLISLLFSALCLAFTHTTLVWAGDNLELENLTGRSETIPVFSGFLTGGLVGLSRGRRAVWAGAAIGTVLSLGYFHLTSFLESRGGRY